MMMMMMKPVKERKIRVSSATPRKVRIQFFKLLHYFMFFLYIEGRGKKRDKEGNEEIIREKCEKFMVDMEQLMTGILDLVRKNTLPDRERGIILKLLMKFVVYFLCFIYKL